MTHGHKRRAFGQRKYEVLGEVVAWKTKNIFLKSGKPFLVPFSPPVHFGDHELMGTKKKGFPNYARTCDFDRLCVGITIRGV